MQPSALDLLKQVAAGMSIPAVRRALQQTHTPITQERVREILEDRLQDFVFRNPVLLKPEVRKELTRKVSAMKSGPETAHFQFVLTYLKELWSVLEKDPAKYRVGPGPLEVLCERVSNGEITLETAETLAKKENITESLTAPYLLRLSGYCRGGAHEGRWRLALQQEKIIRAAIAALPDSKDWGKVRNDLDLDWIEVVHAVLVQLPDGRLYRSALAVGEKLLEHAKNTGDTELFGETSHLLGTMHLDPYSTNFVNVNYQDQIDEWRRKLRDELGDAVSTVPPEQLDMPSPVEALGLAVKYLQQATEFRKESLRPFSLKALGQANKWLEVAGGVEDKSATIRASREALNSVDKVANPLLWVTALDQLAHEGETMDFGPLHELLKTPVDEFVHRLGGLDALQLVDHAASALSGSDPVRSLELYRLSEPLISRFADDRARSNRCDRELNVILTGLAPELPANEPAASLEDRAEKLREGAQQQGWDARKLAAGLILLAAISQKTREEQAGLRLLEEATTVAPVLAANHANALQCLRGNLHLGDGVNHYDRGDWGGAIAGYTRALAEYFRLKLDTRAMNALRRINDLASKEGANVALEVARGLMPLALRIEADLGDPARDLILDTGKRAVASSVKTKINPSLLSLIWQMAKGLRFAAALTSGSRYRRIGEDELGKSLLQKISAFPVEKRIMPPEEDSLLEEAILLSPYRPGLGAQDAPSEEDLIANLQHAYDQHFTARLMAQVPIDDPPYALVDAIQASLDERTVLINYYLGATSDERVALYLLVVTRENVRSLPIGWPLPDAPVRLSAKRATVETNPIGLSVVEIRERIQEYAGPDDPLSQEAAQRLDSALRAYLGNIPEYLDQLRAAGKDHLCIAPHGPLHFLPFHCIRENGRPLAERWIVTYLPNPGLLFSYRGGATIPPERDREITSIGMTFEKINPYGLPTLPQSGAEATAVANVFGTVPILEEQVTKSALIEALEHSRYVHLSTHGCHNVAAPAFQSLFIAPDQDSDGVVYSHELLSYDLRGVEVLTLSACETALGRFDPADNLRGLPASFLLTGVSTLIGTLWEVNADAAEKFFTVFYTELKTGLDRRDAFARAQRDTRAAFPRYADWGAFYYMGAWT
jgi:CHAT domain-containing protein